MITKDLIFDNYPGPEQVRGMTVSPGQWGDGKDSSGMTVSVPLLAERTEMGSLSPEGIGAEAAGGN